MRHTRQCPKCKEYWPVKGWGKAGQIKSLVHELDQDPRWTIEEYDYDDETGKLRIRIRIVQNPFPLIVVVVAIGAIGAGLFAWLTMESIDKVVSSPAGAAISMGAIATAYMAIRTLGKGK